MPHTLIICNNFEDVIDSFYITIDALSRTFPMGNVVTYKYPGAYTLEDEDGYRYTFVDWDHLPLFQRCLKNTNTITVDTFFQRMYE